MWKSAEDFAARIPEGMQAFGSTSRKVFEPLAEQHPVPRLRHAHVRPRIPGWC